MSEALGPVCGTCSIQSVGLNGVRITNQRQWLCAPSPCPECMEAAFEHMRKAGEAAASKRNAAILEALGLPKLSGMEAESGSHAPPAPSVASPEEACQAKSEPH